MNRQVLFQASYHQGFTGFDHGMIRLIVLLGNPGRAYEKTRHNIAWQSAAQLSFYSRLKWQKKFKGLYAQEIVNGEKRLFLKPGTYMNKSGESAAAISQFFKIASGDILVVHDDLELAFGQISFRKGGGLAGHNGLRSIAGCLGTGEFMRFRLGISRPSRGRVSSYVLEKFNENELTVLEVYLNRAAKALEDCLELGIAAAEKK